MPKEKNNNLKIIGVIILIIGIILYLNGFKLGPFNILWEGETWLQFSATNLVTIPDADYLSPSSSNNETTISFWVYMDDLNFKGNKATSEYTNFFEKSDLGTTNCEYMFRMYNTTGMDGTSPRPCRISFYAFNQTCGSGAGSYFQDSCTTLNNTWINVVGRINGTHTSIWKNGVMRDTDPLSGYGIILKNTISKLYIGADNGADIGEWDGQVDDIRIYNRGLTSAEIAEISNLGRGSTNINTNGLVAKYNLDEGDGIIIVDSVFGNNGIITGATWMNNKINIPHGNFLYVDNFSSYSIGFDTMKPNWIPQYPGLVMITNEDKMLINAYTEYGGDRDIHVELNINSIPEAPNPINMAWRFKSMNCNQTWKDAQGVNPQPSSAYLYYYDPDNFIDVEFKAVGGVGTCGEGIAQISSFKRINGVSTALIPYTDYNFMFNRDYNVLLNLEDFNSTNYNLSIYLDGVIKASSVDILKNEIKEGAFLLESAGTMTLFDDFAIYGDAIGSSGGGSSGGGGGGGGNKWINSSLNKQKTNIILNQPQKISQNNILVFLLVGGIIYLFIRRSK